MNSIEIKPAPPVFTTMTIPNQSHSILTLPNRIINRPVPVPLRPSLFVRAQANPLPTIDTSSNLLADQRLVTPSEIVNGILHAGTKAAVAGSSKVGKTWFLLDIATAVASGTPFLRWDTKVGKVLFINFEIHRAFFRNRLHIIIERKKLSNVDNLDVWTLRGRMADFETMLERLIERIRREGYALIILDPLYKLMVGRAENASTAVNLLCHQLEQLVERTGAAVVYAHHFTKGNAAKKKAIDRMSGSGVFARDADTIITLTEHQEQGCYAVEITLRNLPPQESFVVEWQFPVMVERSDLDPADLKTGEEEEVENELQPLLVLLDGKPLTTGEWEAAAKEAGYSRATFYRMKAKLENEKLLAFDRKNKVWSRAAQEDAQAADVETTETAETSA